MQCLVKIAEHASLFRLNMSITKAEKPDGSGLVFGYSFQLNIYKYLNVFFSICFEIVSGVFSFG